MSNPTTDNLQDALAATRLAFALGRTMRATRYPDAVEPESVTDHSVMLALVAADLATKLGDLDPSKVMAFAVVHDLPEAYCGDTDTLLGLDEAGKQAKADREARATQRIRTELGPGSWIADLLRRYEAQAEPEARFVRYVDKVLPKFTQILNDCAGLRAAGVDPGRIEAAHRAQAAALAVEYPEHPEVGALLWLSMERMEAALRHGHPVKEG